MKKISKIIESYFTKVPILYYLLTALIKTFFTVIIIIAILFCVLYATGIYPKLETAFDLKYNSPILIIPMLVFLLLMIVCLVIGFLLYFHKYRRSKHKTKFYISVSMKLNKSNREKNGE